MIQFKNTQKHASVRLLFKRVSFVELTKNLSDVNKRQNTLLVNVKFTFMCQRVDIAIVKLLLAAGYFSLATKFERATASRN